PKHLLEMLTLVEQGTLGGPAAKAVFEEMFHSGRKAQDIVAEQGLSQISDSSEIDKIVEEIMVNNSQAVSDFAAGKEQALTFLVGQVMKASKGRANPNLAKEILLAKVGGKRNV
ncbi:MAG: Asp-tRNA(Asn)/Glu-tRNA(Gln) amidotransferase GatCAB subunit B, partial [Chloroflexi bacterium]|nr:Asp-tRNA(Asn)/Glu-tRNA(Gln) amidotransferase GatCAB subunit B [Chloroflexota bacterium]